MQRLPPRKPGETETEYGRRCENIEGSRARRQEQRQQRANPNQQQQQQQQHSSARGGDGAREQARQHRPTMNADYNGVFRGGDSGSAGSFHSGGGGRGRGRGDESGSSFGSGYFLGGDVYTNYQQQHSSSTRGGGSTPHRSIHSPAVQPSTVDQQQQQQQQQPVFNIVLPGVTTFGLGSSQPAQYDPHNSHPTDAPHNDWGSQSGPPHHDPRSAWGPPQHQYAPPHHNNRPADAPHNDWGSGPPHHDPRSAWGPPQPQYAPPHHNNHPVAFGPGPHSSNRGSQHHVPRHIYPDGGDHLSEGLPPWETPNHHSFRGRHNNSPVDAQRTRHLSHQARRPHSPDGNSPPHSSVVQRPSPSRDWIAGPMHRRRESRDSTLSSEDHREPAAEAKNEDDSDEEVAHAGSGLKAAAKHSSADPSTPHRRKNNDSAVLSEQQNTSEQNQPTVTRRYSTRSANRSTTRAPASVPPPEPAQLRARDLAETNLSRFMEAYLGEKEHMPNNNLVVREVARKEKMFERHSLLCDDDAEEGSEEGHYVERTILVFDELDDADLIKFGLCFQEHGSKSLEENQHTVYIDCIDSVKLRAKGVTLANHSHTFQELLLGYLEYAKSRGFKEYHLWACPPAPRVEDGMEEQSGTPDYLFCPKPPGQQQQTPDEQRLVGHYWTVSRQAYARGILLADSGEPETYAGQYFDDGKLLDKIPLFPGSIVESMLNVCHNNDVDKQMVQQSLGTYLEDGVTGFEEESGCALRNSLIVGTLNADDPDPDTIRAGLEEPPQLFSDLFDDWGRFRANEYASNPDWGFSDYDQVKRTSQGIIAKLHRDVEKKKRRRAKKRA